MNKINAFILILKMTFIAILLIIIKINIKNKKIITSTKYYTKFNYEKKCYLNLDNSNITITHFILTRFIIELPGVLTNQSIIYDDDYILNGIRVMKKYLFPSLENQNCKNFNWVLLLGNKANISYIESLIKLNHSFDSKVLYLENLKSYLKEKTKDFNILITTRIDYDDAIYYDTVNDVRKLITLKKPLIIHGYNRGVSYYEINGKFYDFYYNRKKQGVMSIFCSLILD